MIGATNLQLRLLKYTGTLAHRKQRLTIEQVQYNTTFSFMHALRDLVLVYLALVYLA